MSDISPTKQVKIENERDRNLNSFSVKHESGNNDFWESSDHDEYSPDSNTRSTSQKCSQQGKQKTEAKNVSHLKQEDNEFDSPSSNNSEGNCIEDEAIEG